MNNKTCKKIRKKCRKESKPTEWFQLNNGQVVCSGYRKLYKDIKKAYKNEEK